MNSNSNNNIFPAVNSTDSHATPLISNQNSSISSCGSNPNVHFCENPNGDAAADQADSSENKMTHVGKSVGLLICLMGAFTAGKQMNVAVARNESAQDSTGSSQDVARATKKASLKQLLKELRAEEEEQKDSVAGLREMADRDMEEDEEEEGSQEAAKKDKEDSSVRYTTTTAWFATFVACADTCGNQCVLWSGLFSFGIYSPDAGFCTEQAQIEGTNYAPHMYWLGGFLMFFVFLKFVCESLQALCGCGDNAGVEGDVDV